MKKNNTNNLKPKEKVLDNEEYENALETKSDLTDVILVRSVVKDCIKWGTTIQITEWANKTGFDITQCGSQGSFQHMSITKEELDIIINAINIIK